MRWIKTASLGFLLVQASLVQAQEEATLDLFHRKLSTWTQNLGAWLDARLAGEEHPVPNNKSRLRLGLRAQWSRLNQPAASPILDLRLALPHAEKRWKLIIQEEAPQDTTQTQATENTPPPQPTGQQRATRVGIRLTEKTTYRLLRQISLFGVWRSGKVGVAVEWHNRDHYPLSAQWSRKDTQQLIWESLIGWRGRINYTFDYGISATKLWRLSANLDGYLDPELLELTLSSTLFAWQPKQTSVTAEFYLRWNNQPWGLDQWGPRFSWSRPMIRKWMLFTLTPELRFSRTNHYAANPMLTLSWVMTFSR